MPMKPDVLEWNLKTLESAASGIRTGAANYACSGTTSVIDSAALCDRAGLSLAGSIGRYLQHKTVGDPVCVRTVTGRSVSSYHLASLPPFLDSS